MNDQNMRFMVNFLFSSSSLDLIPAKHFNHARLVLFGASFMLALSKRRTIATNRNNRPSIIASQQSGSQVQFPSKHTAIQSRIQQSTTNATIASERRGAEQKTTGYTRIGQLCGIDDNFIGFQLKSIKRHNVPST